MKRRKNQRVFIGVVTHAHGNNVYVGATQRALDRELAVYVAESISDVEGEEAKKEITVALKERRWDDAVQAYFEAMAEMNSEWLDAEGSDTVAVEEEKPVRGFRPKRVKS